MTEKRYVSYYSRPENSSRLTTRRTSSDLPARIGGGAYDIYLQDPESPSVLIHEVDFWNENLEGSVHYSETIQDGE
jgi:hypothetical protein